MSRTVRFRCKISRTHPEPTMEWSHDGSLLTHDRAFMSLGDENCLLRLQNVTLADEGLYTCTICNEHGCCTSTARLTVIGRVTHMCIVCTDFYLCVYMYRLFTHCPSSQGWEYTSVSLRLNMYMYVCMYILSLCLVWCPGCDYLSFFPLCTFLASVLHVCTVHAFPYAL